MAGQDFAFVLNGAAFMQITPVTMDSDGVTPKSYGMSQLVSMADLKTFFSAGIDPTDLPAATTAAQGAVKRMTSVPQLAAQTVTDIASAQTSITAIVTKVNALLTAAVVAGVGTA